VARQTEPVCKLCRREGEKLFLKGARCTSPKCAVERRPYPAGQHGNTTQFKRGRNSDYSSQLREKQKTRRIYGVLERQFRRYFAEALRRPGMTGANLLSILEGRFDNVIYRLGLADSRPHARQLVQHGHFDINGQKVNIPSYSIKATDVITVHGKSKNIAYFREIQGYMDQRPRAPEWLEVNVGNDGIIARVLRVPERRDVEQPINEQLIVEFYSR
jgi:small subunit ribosomal protein S4